MLFVYVRQPGFLRIPPDPPDFEYVISEYDININFMSTEYLLWDLFMSAGPDSQDFELTIRISGHKHKHKPELSVVEPGL